MSDTWAVEVRARFNLHDGQFFATNRVKNLWWFLNGRKFGYGDLREKDLNTIFVCLEPGEVFEGFNEHHMTQFMQRETPMVRINVVEITFPPHIPVSNETRRKIKSL